METPQLRIRVKIDNKEVEMSYPLSERTQVDYNSNSSTLVSAVKAISDIIDKMETIK